MVRDLARHRDFRLPFAGRTLSMFGDMAMLLVLGMWAKELTGSNGIAGSVFAALVLPSLLAPAAGVVIDRYRRRTVMVVTDVSTATVVLLLLLVDGPGAHLPRGLLLREALRLVAPLAGAGLYAGLGGPAVAVLDATTFLLSAVALLAMRVDEPEPAPSGTQLLVEASGPSSSSVCSARSREWVRSSPVW